MEENEHNASEVNQMSDDDEEDLGRTDEVIDLDQVTSQTTSIKKKNPKSLLPADYKPEETPEPLVSSKVEEQISLNIASQEGLREALEFQMRIFDF